MPVKLRIYTKKFENAEIKNSMVNTIKLGKMIEGNLGRMGVNIAGMVLTSMENRIEAKRLRKNPIGKHDLTLEPWRLTAGRNLMAVLRESVEIRKEPNGNNFRYRFLLGREKFLHDHAPYWRMLDKGGKIKIKTPTGGVPGYFGGGVLPSAHRGGVESFHWTGSNSLGTKGPKGAFISLMIPEKLIKGIGYLAVGYSTFLKKAAEGLRKRKQAVKRSIIEAKRSGRVDKTVLAKTQRELNVIDNEDQSKINKEIAQTLEQKAAAAGMSVPQYLQAKQRGVI